MPIPTAPASQRPQQAKTPHAGFAPDERARLLALRGVGPTVVQRLEEAGFERLDQLAGLDAAAITQRIAHMLRASCWHNSPQARAAIAAVVALANAQGAGS